MDARAVKMFVTAIVSVLVMLAGARPTDAGCQVCHRKCCVHYGHGYKECFMARDPVTGECLWCMAGGELCSPDPAMTEAEDEKPACRASRVRLATDLPRDRGDAESR
jgi:hypothetical protein